MIYLKLENGELSLLMKTIEVIVKVIGGEEEP